MTAEVPIVRPMRIGMVCPYSLTLPGGVQSQVLGLAREMRRRGHEVRVLAPCDGPPPESFVTSLGDSLPTSANGSVAPVAPDPAATLRTIGCLREERFDVLHVHEPLAPGPSIATVTMNTAPIVGTFHAAGTSRMYRVFARPLRRFLRRIAYPVAVSKDAADLVERHLGGTLEVLWNGVDVTGGPPDVGVAPERPALLFLGRHEERKGLDVLLRAVSMIESDLRIWVAGSGPDTEHLQRRYRHDTRIEWLGRISDADKLSRLARASVVCAPSLHGESFGVVLGEAMAAGTPVVASDLDGYRNVVSDGRTALLVAPGDAEALAAALVAVLTDSDLAQRLIQAGLERANELSMERLAERYEAIYRSILH